MCSKEDTKSFMQIKRKMLCSNRPRLRGRQILRLLSKLKDASGHQLDLDDGENGDPSDSEEIVGAVRRPAPDQVMHIGRMVLGRSG